MTSREDPIELSSDEEVISDDEPEVLLTIHGGHSNYRGAPGNPRRLQAHNPVPPVQRRPNFADNRELPHPRDAFPPISPTTRERWRKHGEKHEMHNQEIRAHGMGRNPPMEPNRRIEFITIDSDDEEGPVENDRNAGVENEAARLDGKESRHVPRPSSHTLAPAQIAPNPVVRSNSCHTEPILPDAPEDVTPSQNPLPTDSSSNDSNTASAAPVQEVQEDSPTGIASTSSGAPDEHSNAPETSSNLVPVPEDVEIVQDAPEAPVSSNVLDVMDSEEPRRSCKRTHEEKEVEQVSRKTPKVDEASESPLHVEEDDAPENVPPKPAPESMDCSIHVAREDVPQASVPEFMNFSINVAPKDVLQASTSSVQLEDVPTTSSKIPEPVLESDVVQNQDDVAEEAAPIIHDDFIQNAPEDVPAPITDDGKPVEIHIPRGTKLHLGTSRIPFHVKTPDSAEQIIKMLKIVPGKALPEGVPATCVEVESDDEEEQEDDDKEEDEGEEVKEEKKNKIREGAEFQVECPDLIETASREDEEDRDEQMWCPPPSMGLEKDDQFFKSIREDLWWPIWSQYQSQIPYEIVLKALKENGYRIADCLDVIDQWLDRVPQKMKDPTVGQASQLLKIVNSEETSNRVIQHTIMRNYTIGEIYLYRWRFARFHGRETDERELFDPEIADKFQDKHWEIRHEETQKHLKKDLAKLKKKYVEASGQELFEEWKANRWEKRKPFMVHYGLNGKVGCNCMEPMCRDISYEPRYGCSRCTDSQRARKLDPDLLCLICQVYKQLTGQDRPMRAAVFDDEDSDKLQNWIRMEQHLKKNLKREEFERRMAEERDNRWSRLELYPEEVLTLNFNALSIKELSVKRLEKQAKAKLGQLVKEQLQPHILPHFGICRCKESGCIPSGSTNFMMKFPILLGRRKAFDPKNSDVMKTFCDAIAKYPGNIKRAAAELDVEQELVEMFLDEVPASSKFWKGHPKKDYRKYPVRELLPARNWPWSSDSLELN